MIREFDAEIGFEPNLPSVDGDNHDAPLDGTRAYLQEIGRIPLLTREEEILLSRRIHRGLAIVRPNENNPPTLVGCDPTTYPPEQALILNEALRAKGHLVEGNLRLVVSIAKRYLGRGMGFLDLIQEGNLGLMHAAERFDPEKGYKFSTYSTWWIRQAVTRAIANHSRTIRLPVHVTDSLGEIARAKQHLEQESYIGEPPVESIAKVLGEKKYTPRKVEELQGYASSTISLDTTDFGDSYATLGDTIEDQSEPLPDSMAEKSALKVTVSQVLQSLIGRERLILEMRYGLRDGIAHTLEEIGREFGVTRERIRQIEAKALRKLRHPSRSKKLIGYLDK